MKSLIAKRSVAVDSHKTSVSLEDDFWSALRDIAKQRNQGMAQLIGSIDAERDHGNLSSAIRLFILQQYREQFARRNSTVNRA